MAKRFTDTNKYKKPFIRGLQGPYKLLWDYLYHDCDHAGIWIVDFEIAQLYLGADMPVNKSDALKYFNNGEIRIIEFDGCKKWLIPSFIEFQYGVLNEQNRVHNSIILELKKYKIDFKDLISPLQGAKDKEEEKDIDKEEGGCGGENVFTKGIKYISYKEIVNRATEFGIDIWEQYKPVIFKGRSKPVFVFIDDIKKYNLEIVKQKQSNVTI
jgi:hypothetical protein